MFLVVQLNDASVKATFLNYTSVETHVSETQVHTHLPFCKRNQVNSSRALGGQGLLHNCFRHFLNRGCEDESAGLS